MSPPLSADGSRLTRVPAESDKQHPDDGLGLPHSDPTFYEVAKRLDWGEGDWTLRGPAFEDGTYPIVRIEWRLGAIILKLLERFGRISLSRSQRKALSKGESLKSIRFQKKTTPTASDANQGRGEGLTENTSR